MLIKNIILSTTNLSYSMLSENMIRKTSHDNNISILFIQNIIARKTNSN